MKLFAQNKGDIFYWCISLVYLAAAAGKMASPQEFYLFISSVIPAVPPMLLFTAVVTLEIILSAAFVLRRMRIAAAYGSALMLLGYTGVLIYADTLSGAGRCGCFGIFAASESVDMSVTRNLLLSIVSLWVINFRQRQEETSIREHVMSLVWANFRLTPKVRRRETAVYIRFITTQKNSVLAGVPDGDGEREASLPHRPDQFGGQQPVQFPVSRDGDAVCFDTRDAGGLHHDARRG